MIYCDLILIFFGNTQNVHENFMQSLINVLIFLSVFAFLGYCIVHFYKWGSFIKRDGSVKKIEDNKINILDNKFLYGRKYITLVECCGRKMLIIINKDDVVKLSEWDSKQDEIDR